MAGTWTRRRHARPNPHPDATERRLKEERAAAAGIVRTIRELLDAGQAISPPAPEWITVAVAEELGEIFEEVADRSRRQGRAIVECALEIATALDDSYPRETRIATQAVAWTNVATADLRDHAPRAALKCLEEANRVLGDDPETAPLRASVDVSRATVLHTLGRDQEARKFVARARAVFEEAGHHAGLAQCDDVEAMIGRRKRPRR